MKQSATSAFVLRLPTPLNREVQRVARENRRSMTKEIQVAVEKHVTPQATR